VLVTRPQPQADEWVQRLRDLGQQAAALPLLAIEALPGDDPALQLAWRQVEGCRLLMFVSPNAVAAFMAGRPPGWVWPQGLLAGATGPGTVAALRAQGVPDASIASPRPDAAQFDAETLWAHRLEREDWAGRRVLIVRASEGRDWLSERLTAQGAQVTPVTAYRRCAPRLGEAERALLRRVVQAPQQHAWLLSSSEALGHLSGCLAELAEADWAPALRQVPAWATHPRIADNARAAGFAKVHAAQPDPAWLVRALHEA
jgi:uroporphyrinogen-III synthase